MLTLPFLAAPLAEHIEAGLVEAEDANPTHSLERRVVRVSLYSSPTWIEGGRDKCRLGLHSSILIYLHQHFAFAINCPVCAVSVIAVLKACVAAASRFRHLAWTLTGKKLARYFAGADRVR